MAAHQLLVTPCRKPTMVASDRWKKRPPVLRYRAFCDAIRAEAQRVGLPLDRILEGSRVTFYLPMPPSWSQKKRAAMAGQPHEQTPDLSNLLKAYEDALLPQDCAVWNYAGLTKRWGAYGCIVVEVP